MMTDSRVFKYLIDLVFPNRCPCCDSVIPYDSYICNDCLLKISISDGERCVRCGQIICNCCNDMNFDKLFCYSVYEGTLREGILNLKLNKGLGLAEYYAMIIADRLKSDMDNLNIDCVTSVPMDKSKQRCRGYNQAEVFARLLAKKINVEYINLLDRTRKNTTQHFLTYNERKQNVNNLFKSVKFVNKKYKHILLCDDIITTGMTLNSCSKVLKDCGSGKIFCVVLASTNKN